MRAQQSTGVMPRALQTPPAPPALAHLLPIFTEVASARQRDFGTPLPIAWSEIEAWGRLMGLALTPLEAGTLRLLDACWLGAWQKAQPKAH